MMTHIFKYGLATKPKGEAIKSLLKATFPTLKSICRYQCSFMLSESLKNLLIFC